MTHSTTLPTEPENKKDCIGALLIRAAFVFVLIAIVPMDLNYLKSVISLPWTSLRYVDVDTISNYYPWFIDDRGMGDDYLGLFIGIVISFLIAGVWLLIDKRRSREELFYWTTVLIRYKVAGVMFYFAFVKVFPVQMPFPSVSQLNTLVGDYTPGRLFWITTGASPFYEVFGGLVELLGTFLLLFRRTFTLGAIILIGVMVPVVALNIGYDAGVQVKSMVILLLAIILVAENARQFWDLLILHKTTQLRLPKPPVIRKAWKRKLRIALKVGFILFFFAFRGYSVGHSFLSGKSYKLPEAAAIPEWQGLYDVGVFKVNNEDTVNAVADSIRWHNVIFERWNTISIKDGRRVQMLVNNSVRKTEVHANGGRQYYGYTADTLKRELFLTSRRDTSQHLRLHYTLVDGTLVLRGINEYNDSIYAQLRKVDRIYPLVEKKGNYSYQPY